MVSVYAIAIGRGGGEQFFSVRGGGRELERHQDWDERGTLIDFEWLVEVEQNVSSGRLR